MSAPHRRRRPEAGFTLIEVLAVVLLTALVLGMALDFYTDLSNASTRATESTRELRRATAILDRVARDLQAAVLVTKPPEEDPLNHPWVFLGESRDSELGADHVKFVTWGHRPRSPDAHESDLAMIAYLTRETDDGTVELLRWTSPRLPEGLERDFPFADDPNVTLLADGLDAFGLRFFDEEGGQTNTWDSSQLVESSELPLAVEINVRIAPETIYGDDDDWADPDYGEGESVHSRVVALPMRPIDLQVLLDPLGAQAGEGDGDEDGEGDDDDDDTGRTRSIGECFPDASVYAGTPLETWLNNNGGIWAPFDPAAMAQIQLPDGRTALDLAAPQCR